MADNETELRALIAILDQVHDKTTCPDPGEGGCIGGPIPGYGCIHEAVGYVIRRMKVLASEPHKVECPECEDTGEACDGFKSYTCECPAGRRLEERYKKGR